MLDIWAEGGKYYILLPRLAGVPLAMDLSVPHRPWARAGAHHRPGVTVAARPITVAARPIRVSPRQEDKEEKAVQASFVSRCVSLIVLMPSLCKHHCAIAHNPA